jgi:aminomethyltransferase
MEVEIDIRGKKYNAIIMPYLLKSEAAPYSRTISSKYYFPKKYEVSSDVTIPNYIDSVNILLNKSISNTIWRQKECINLIPSEQTPSKMVKLLSAMDPAGRYAEHKKLEAFYDKEVFFYQGVAFIAEVEKLLIKELKKYLSCSQVETRAISGQMANMIVFSALVDFLNRVDVKNEFKRIPQILNHHIMAGGHLSAQPMGALQDFVIKDPKTDRYAVINFPVLEDDPYQINIKETQKLIETYKPKLIIFGKSMTIYKEPVLNIKKFIQELNLDCLILYDMAHVLGLVGKYFQEPFSEGADIVTASTHKTFLGTQRGIIATNFLEPDLYCQLWKAIEKRTFPGSTSNHHLGTLLGLLMASYEMNYFRDEYQKKVISNAKVFAKALKNCSLNVAGNPDLGYTQTHQVIIDVGSFKAPLIAKVLEESNIIVNYQATYRDEGFTASGSIRMGVAEMTRFGMEDKDFEELAQLIFEVIKKQRNVKDETVKLRQRFLNMKYCFNESRYNELLEQINDLI